MIYNLRTSKRGCTLDGLSGRESYFIRIACISIAFILFTLINIVSAETGSLVATWNANQEEDLAGYKLYYGTTSGNRSGWTVTDVGDTTQYVITNLVLGQTYYVVVTAYDWAGNESAASTEQSAVATSRQARALFTSTATGVTIQWDAVNGASSYDVYSSTTPNFTPQTPVANVTTAQYVDSTFPRTAEYGRYYIVKAKSGASEIFTFQTVGAFNLKLKTGKNLVSLPLVPADSTLAGVLGTQLRGSNISSKADKVHVWNGTDYTMAWLVEGTSSIYEGKWLRKTGDQVSTIKLNPNQSFWIEVVNTLSATDSIITVTGKVSKDAFKTLTLNPGTNFVGSCFPATVTLKNSSLGQSGAVIGSTFSSGADKVMHWKGTNNYEVAWLVSGSGTSWDGEWVNERGDALSDMAFKAGHGYIIIVKNDNPNKTWQFPKPY
ncbi:MAG TPA: fibronectin type III domain-containing protein [bacterium]|nr:fibronectin type III domain-containing protein [bacterium]HPN42428.1 fibronectin type III domain-containing protein [bacterium]